MDNTALPTGDSNDQPAITPNNKSTKPRLQWWLAAAAMVIVIAAGAAIALGSRHAPTKPTVGTTATPAPTASASPTSANPNHWKETVSATALPLGDGHVSTSPQVGYVDSCITAFPKAGGARHSGSWLTGTTWNSQLKPAVEGSVTWPNAQYSATASGTSRVITTNDLPVGLPTGTFPISRSDPAYQYDTNPNAITAHATTFTLPLNPTAAGTPSCTGLGPIGVLTDGVFLYNALDAGGRDAGAHEIQDACGGHPDGSDRYHYHSVSACMLKTATGASTLVGYALDGYGIYVERDASGNLPTNADLDACHGRTSPVMWNGHLTDIYHYDATLEYPYDVGCFHGTPINLPRTR